LYNDIAGQCTQGIRDKVHDGKCTLQDIDNYNNEYPNGGMTEAQAEQLLRTDIQAKERQVSNALGRNVELTQNQFDALILLSFNVGAQGALGKDKSLGEHIRAGKCDHTTIAHDFNQFNKVKLIDPITKEPIRDPITGKYVLVEDNGLSLRRASEAAMFNFGVY
jgi:GH24 family phage-related lysozyme (muramidase)